MHRGKSIRALIPIAPPCFQTRMAWTEYVEAAAVAQKLDAEAGPLVMKKGGPVSFNASWSFCQDCEAGYRTAMLKRDRCDPSFVRKQLQESVKAAEPEGEVAGG